jgi:drug/metabolite transporter (DMT)-like permease
MSRRQFVSISSQVPNIASVLLAFVILAELPGPLQIVGSAIIIAGVIVAAMHRPSRPAPSPPPED